jgi:hypothetical protein
MRPVLPTIVEHLVTPSINPGVWSGARPSTIVRPSLPETIQGVVATLVCSFAPCLILVETWPSWVTLCLRFDATPVIIYWYNASEELCASFSVVSPFRWLTWSCLPPSPSDNSFVFIQGSTSFLDHLPRAYVDHPYVLAVCDDHNALSSLPLAWHSSVYDSSDYGGVIAGPWHISSSLPLPTSLASSRSYLSTTRLRHFLVSTVRGGVYSFVFDDFKYRS